MRGTYDTLVSRVQMSGTFHTLAARGQMSGTYVQDVGSAL